MPPRRRQQEQQHDHDDDDYDGCRRAGPSGRGAGGGGGGGGGGSVQAVHRFAFAQHLMKHGCMPEAKAKEAFQRLTGLDSDDAYRRMVADQNREMQSLNLKIRTLKYPVDHQRYVGLVNTHADGPSKAGTRYTPYEREFFRMVMEAIALDEDARNGVGAVGSITLLNMEVRPPVAQAGRVKEEGGGGGSGAGPSTQAQQGTQAAAGPKMSKPAKEAALAKLVSDGWLTHSAERGRYCLGARTFLELGPTLLELPDLPDATRQAWEDMM